MIVLNLLKTLDHQQFNDSLLIINTFIDLAAEGTVSLQINDHIINIIFKTLQVQSNKLKIIHSN